MSREMGGPYLPLDENDLVKLSSLLGEVVGEIKPKMDEIEKLKLENKQLRAQLDLWVEWGQRQPK